VVSPPNSSHIFQSWPTTLAIFEDTTKKPIVTKANNSIDVHNLQKNIDDWTIEVRHVFLISVFLISVYIYK